MIISGDSGFFMLACAAEKTFNQARGDLAFFGPSTPKISNGALKVVFKLPRLWRTVNFSDRTVAVADFTLVLPTLPTTAISLVSG